jgi:PHP family Zn ribbon phosphoesterase
MVRKTVITYGEDFESDIRSILRDRDLARERLFQWWLGDGTVFACEKCETEFTPDDSVAEDDEVLCEKCQRKRRS